MPLLLLLRCSPVCLTDRPYADADPAEPEYYRREPHTPYPREPENPYRRDPESYYPREPESYYRVEPEQERLCLFLGTERLGVVYVYDISNPYRPQFQSVARPPVASDGKSLSAPEGLTYARCVLTRVPFYSLQCCSQSAKQHLATCASRPMTHHEQWLAAQLCRLQPPSH